MQSLHSSFRVQISRGSGEHVCDRNVTPITVELTSALPSNLIRHPAIFTMGGEYAASLHGGPAWPAFIQSFLVYVGMLGCLGSSIQTGSLCLSTHGSEVGCSRAVLQQLISLILHGIRTFVLPASYLRLDSGDASCREMHLDMSAAAVLWAHTDLSVPCRFLHFSP